MLTIGSDTSADLTLRLLKLSTNLLLKSVFRLSSGRRLTSPAEDPGGFAISSRLNAEERRVGAALQNIGNTTSFAQTQDGFLQQVEDSLDRLSELAVLATDSTKTASDRALYDTEFTSLSAVIDQLATKDFNGVSLFDGAAFPVTTGGEGAPFALSGVNLGSSTLTAATGSSVSTTTNAATALTNVTAAISQLTLDRTSVRSNLSLLQQYSDTLATLKFNLSATVSRIRDADIAAETTRFARAKILVEAGTALAGQTRLLQKSAFALIDKPFEIRA